MIALTFPAKMNARERELLARHCLLHLDEIIKLWHGRDWGRLLAVVKYAEAGIPAEMSKTDPYMYRKLCAGLCEYHIRGFDRFNPEAIARLAQARTPATIEPALA